MKKNLQTTIESISNTQEKLLYRRFKRLFDIIFSLIALILLSPILLGVSLAIVLEDRGSILFKQKRTGLNHVPFLILKFRSMKEDNQLLKKNVESPYQWDNGVPDDFIFKTTDSFNPNVTRVGQFIRKTSLDELPQFINVLLGNMSIIGPRPEIIEITKCYSKEQGKRLLVKPGITGWAQVNGRSDCNHGEKIKNDLYYVANASFKLDIRIFFMTIYQTLFGKGAI